MQEQSSRLAEQNSVQTFESQVERDCITEKLFTKSLSGQTASEGDFVVRLAIGVSGGADSMALLRCMLRLAPRYGLCVSACHINHGMRGAHADADEAFVRAQCAALGVPLTVHRVPANEVPEGASEAWARSVRYAYFDTLIAEQGALLATAHTQNDQAETLLFRLARGTGVHGAAGIRARRGAYIRPFLNVTRAQVENYCAAIGQEFVIDETNLSSQYARNRLRGEAVPALQSVNDGALAHIGAFCDKMAHADAYIAAQGGALLAQAAQGAQAANAWSLEILQGAAQGVDALVCEQALYQLVRPVRDAEQKYTDALMNLVREGTGAVQLTDTVRFVANGGFLLCEECATPPVRRGQGASDPQRTGEGSAPKIPFALGEYHFAGGYSFKIELVSVQNYEKIQSVHKKDLKNVADYAKMVASLFLRCRQQGDCYSPAGRGCTKSLKKYYNELGLCAQERAQLPLLAQENTVVWLWGQGVAQDFLPTKETTLLLKFTEEKQSEDANNEHG